MSKPSRDTKERMFERIDKSEMGCWLYTGRLNDDGYFFIHHEGKIQQGHRVAYKLFKGEIPAGMCVLHTCDTRNCINPDHLELGTQARNMAEAGERGHMRGKVGRHWFDPETISEIKNLIASGKTWREVAAQFGITRNTVWRIIKGHNKYGRKAEA